MSFPPQRSAQVQAAIDALTLLYKDMERDTHLPLVDVPSGTNLDSRLVTLASIIAALKADA